MNKDKKSKPYDAAEALKKRMMGKGPKMDEMPANKVMTKMPKPKKNPKRK